MDRALSFPIGRFGLCLRCTKPCPFPQRVKIQVVVIFHPDRSGFGMKIARWRERFDSNVTLRMKTSSRVKTSLHTPTFHITLTRHFKV